MTRDEWKAFHHAIRSHARSFQATHGGYPCFRAYFQHNGAEITFTRYQDYRPEWLSYMRASEIRQRPVASHIHAELDCAAAFRIKAKQFWHTAYTHKRGAHLAIKCARAWRLERTSGWHAAQSAA